MWPEIIYNGDDYLTEESEHEPEKYRELFTLPIAEGLFNDMKRLNNIVKFSDVAA